ncbi:MAG: DEAD/DEAH box helicase [Fermentimonas sp.]|jgi:DNA replication ATP-dependent helicase Dna2
MSNSPSTSSNNLYLSIKVKLISVINDKKLLLCSDYNNPESKIYVSYYDDKLSDNQTNYIEQFWHGATINLIDCTTDSEGILFPTFIVLEPDYLIDASSIAECFQSYLISPLHFFRNRFFQIDNSASILLGNLANFFLDELIYLANSEDITFKDVFYKSFIQSPIEYTTCVDIREDGDFRNFMSRAYVIFENIKRVINNDLESKDIDADFCTLEPSFFSAKYGFQGRLDLLELKPHNNYKQTAHIIELKSGRLPYPESDVHKISLNHLAQTYIYHLLIESVFEKQNIETKAYILYAASTISGTNIRNAGINERFIKYILNIRNTIIINEHHIINEGPAFIHALFKTMISQAEGSTNLPPFYIGKINYLSNSLRASTSTELTYFYRFTQFVSQEMYHSKIGNVDSDSPIGMASLWNSSFQERAKSLDVVYNLTISSRHFSKNNMTIVFQRDINSNNNNEITNFRDGDICIVYPRENNTDNVLNKQILKGNIVRITKEKITVRFRHKQRNLHYFQNNNLWAIEHDSLDSSFNQMYKSLFAFISATSKKKNLLLGIEPPHYKEYETKLQQNDISIQHNKHTEAIVQKALHADDYFLIIGPPGTGKTSIVARRIIEEYYKSPDTNILVLAYTNRAVDELCDAISIAVCKDDNPLDHFIRIGSELSCEEKYRPTLLQNVSENFSNRESLKSKIINTRIFVSTISSLAGKMEIFSLKKFDVAIIDEASQVLEPQIIGILPNFQKFILIGDHNQLSTIVLQSEDSSKIKEASLRKIGITNCRISFFERLLNRCISQGWTNSYAQLSLQGRMHDDIAKFPASKFYKGNLFIANNWQTSDWQLTTSYDSILHQIVTNHRNALISTTPTADDSNYYNTNNHNGIMTSYKTNHDEAEIVVALINAIKQAYSENNMPFTPSSIGIIAPYRNQIALIRHKIQESNLDDFENIMIDTIERFQGSQRDIIIISLCINDVVQFKYLCNLNEDGTVDRKLNVALTRSRNQLFIVGNSHLMQQNPIYNSLLEAYKDKTFYLSNYSLH